VVIPKNPNDSAMQSLWIEQKQLADSTSLYFHIPFCTKKCDYCHFYVLPDKEPLKISFMEGLKLEWQLRLPQLLGKKIGSVYFGGGTPYLLGAPAIHEILSWVFASLQPAKRQIEITLEANPENIELESMRAYSQAGVNRISMGVQTLDDKLLPLIGRQHNSQRSLKAIDLTASAGIENISIDLMYDLPQQSLTSWRNTLGPIHDLPITHLSLYNMTIEPQSAFFKYRHKLIPQLPDEETSLQMFIAAQEQLAKAGLAQYEISAFCRKGRYAEHNVGYWTGRQFLGFGPSAFSYWDRNRFRNIANLSKYSAQLKDGQLPVDFTECLEKDAQAREMLAIGLRLLEGIDLEQFQKQYPLDPDTLKAVDGLIKNGLLERQGKQIKLSSQGILFYDSIASEII
jgi:oxygen-independent coproporphyrinogen-3 oxidase